MQPLCVDVTLALMRSDFLAVLDLLGLQLLSPSLCFFQSLGHCRISSIVLEEFADTFD